MNRTLRQFSRIALLTAAAVFVLGPVVAAEDEATQAAKTAAPSAANWAENLWNAARQGDDQSVKKALRQVPADTADDPLGEHVRQAVKLHKSNLETIASRRAESRQEARERLEKQLNESNLTLALEAAVEVQTLSDDLDSALDDPQIATVIEQARARIPEVEKQHDWLLAQELLYRLRTLYEDTNQQDHYEKYDNHLDRINRRVSLLARYAPRRLHEMRDAALKRAGEEPLGEFNPATAIDWREKLEDIDGRMVRSALRAAAQQHIESHGWQPLLIGGLQELKLLVTTTAIAEAFATIADDEKVEQWVSEIDARINAIRNKRESELNAWTLSRMLDDLLRLNDRTLQLPRTVVYREFGDGAMYELDRFSEIIWPAELRRFQQATAGNFVGVGILIRHNEKKEIKVVNPLEGSPAYYAGVKPDDVITEVDGESTVGWSLNDAVDRITGPKGEKVTLGVRREGHEDILQITIERDVIKLRSVKGWWKSDLDENGNPKWDWYVDPVTRIAYIRLTQFTEDSLNDLLAAWEDITKDGKPNGLVLDLRYNPGGLLTAAVNIANLFLHEGTIVSGEDKRGQRTWVQRAEPQGARFNGVPTVVLINKGSASASEIVAGCLQAYGKAIIVGTRSYGKGSVQTVHPIARDARLKLTTQYYRLPPNQRLNEEQGRLVHKRPGASEWGVDPDIEVDMSPYQVSKSIELRREADIIPENDQGRLDPDSEQRPELRRLIVEGLDPQLETALLLLQARALGEAVTNDEVKKASLQ